ncbi:MAG: aspartate carbamoyltransferase catalytic subunit [Saccharofermentanales bacterium]
MNLKYKDLLGLRELSEEEIMLILDTAFVMKNVLVSGNKKTAHLQGKSVVTLFYENSTRTRLSFEMASKFMGASSANISTTGSSVNKGENLADTAMTIDAMATDIIVMRHPVSGAPHYISDKVGASVVNAGDGMNEHPTQALLDMMTIIENKKSLSGLKVAIVGDIYHSRVARSNIWGMAKLGADVYIAGPSTMIPVGIEMTGAKICSNVQEACEGADIIMALRLQTERQKSSLFPSIQEYSRFFGVDDKVLSLARNDVMVMHPGPCNHGVEMTTSVYESDASYINEQVTNGVAIRMAVLYLLNSRRNAL